MTSAHDVFCLIPWIHFQIWPNGDVQPCCFSANDYEQNLVGNIDKFDRLADIANTEKLKSLRKRMLNDGELPECKTCVQSEKASGSSFRLDFKRDFTKHIDESVEKIVSTTADDGSINDFKMRYLDVRFSTVCNQKCRTCGPHFSSAWALEEGHRSKIQSIFSGTTTPIYEELQSDNVINDVRIFYFAGGEPLVTPEHFRMLPKIDLEKSSVTYNTNFSNLHWNKTDVLDYWKNMKSLTVFASVDATYEKYEYMRKGTRFDTIVGNFYAFNQIKSADRSVSINLTVSIFNVFYLPEIIKDFYELGFVNDGGLPMTISFVFNPEHFKITVFTPEQKEVIATKLRTFGETDQRFKTHMNNVINFMNASDDQTLLPKMKDEIKRIDAVRNESFDLIFPELSQLIDYE